MNRHETMTRQGVCQLLPHRGRLFRTRPERVLGIPGPAYTAGADTERDVILHMAGRVDLLYPTKNKKVQKVLSQIVFVPRYIIR